MTNYREILRLQALGFNNSRIADSTGATRQTVTADEARKFLELLGTTVVMPSELPKAASG